MSQPSAAGARGVLRRWATILAVAFMLGACAGPAPNAEDGTSEGSTYLDAARRAYEAERYEEARRLLMPLARDGISEAQYALGYLFYYGLGGRIDRDRGRHWIEQAAEQKDPKALEARGWLRGSEERPEENGAEGSSAPTRR